MLEPEPPCHTSAVPPWLFRGQGLEGMSDSVSKAVGRQTKHRAVVSPTLQMVPPFQAQGQTLVEPEYQEFIHPICAVS